MKFSVFVVDSPWSFSDPLSMSDTKRGANSNYDTLSNKDLINLDIKSLIDPEGAILVLWVPSTLLELGLKCMESYGFKYKQNYIWVKNKKEPLKKIFSNIKKIKIDKFFIKNIKNVFNNFNLSDVLGFNMGRLFRQTHEIALVGTSNNKIYKKLKNKSQRSVSFGVNEKHSKKPEHLQDSLDLMFSDPSIKKVELFARRQRSGYLCLGNDSPMSNKQDIRKSIETLKNLSEEDFNKILPLTDNNHNKELFDYWDKL